MPIFMTARFKVKPESQAKCEQAIRAFIDDIKVNEPGTPRYTSLQHADDPLSYLHFFIFADAAAREKHSSSESVQRFTAVLYPELQAPVEFTEYGVIAST